MRITTRARRKAVINITSLIDVLFLLLIFFMVSSTFEQRPGMLLDLPAAETSVPTEQRQLILSVNADGILFLNDTPISESDLAPLLEAELQGGAEPSLILQADGSVEHRTVVHLMDVAKQVGIVKLVIATKDR